MLIALMLATASVAGDLPAADDGSTICRNARPGVADRSRGDTPAELFRRLDELPPVNLELTVLRRENGCEVPVIVRYGIGARPDVGR